MTSGLPELSIIPSLQRYEAMGSDEWRYIDLGASKGFTAVLTSDDQGLVHRYEGLFETIGGRGALLLRPASRGPASASMR